MASPSGTGSGGYNAGDETDRHSRLFPKAATDPTLDPLKTPHYSSVFFVKDSWVVVRAYNMPENAVACVEMVTGCKGGDTYESFKLYGACWCVCACSNTLVIPLEGRYRIKLIGADPEDVTITQIPHSINMPVGDIIAMANGCPSPFDPLQAANALSHDENAMLLLSNALHAQAVASRIAGDPEAVATLCTALYECIKTAATEVSHVPAVIGGDAVIEVQVSGVDNQTFALSFAAHEAALAIVADANALDALQEALCLKTHAPAQMVSSDGSVSIDATGLDGQSFDLSVNLGTVFGLTTAVPSVINAAEARNNAGVLEGYFIPLDTPKLIGAGTAILRPDGYFTVNGKKVPFVN